MRRTCQLPLTPVFVRHPAHKKYLRKRHQADADAVLCLGAFPNSICPARTPPQQPLPSIPSLLRLSWAFSPSSSSSHALPSPIWHLTVSSEPSCSCPSLPTGCMCTRPGTRMDIVPLLSAHACLYHDTHVLSTSPYTPAADAATTAFSLHSLASSTTNSRPAQHLQIGSVSPPLL